ncbi:MAG: hypothetical protein JEY99_13360 [Spirochaetales bacterium]|nr:hypothetical protein [Spirochaetales bacterium]
MKIFVNDLELDFKLENEKDLRQVISSVRDWLIEEGHFLQAINVDGIDISEKSEAEWAKVGLESIERIDFKAVNGLELRLQYLHTLHQFFTLLQRSLEEKNLPLMQQNLNNYEIIKEYLRIIFPAEKSDTMTLADKVDNFLSESGVLNAEKIPENTAEILQLISSLVNIISELIREITSPLKEIINTAELLKKLIPPMEDVSVQLQTGKDKDAMKTVITFTELSQKLIRIYPFLKAQGILDTSSAKIMDLPFDEFYKNFNTILLDLANAFGAGDSVLLGDLLEYEVAPRLDGLSSFLHELNKEE